MDDPLSAALHSRLGSSAFAAVGSNPSPDSGPAQDKPSSPKLSWRRIPIKVHTAIRKVRPWHSLRPGTAVARHDTRGESQVIRFWLRSPCAANPAGLRPSEGEKTEARLIEMRLSRPSHSSRWINSYGRNVSQCRGRQFQNGIVESANETSLSLQRELCTGRRGPK